MVFLKFIFVIMILIPLAGLMMFILGRLGGDLKGLRRNAPVEDINVEKKRPKGKKIKRRRESENRSKAIRTNKRKKSKESPEGKVHPFNKPNPDEGFAGLNSYRRSMSSSRPASPVWEDTNPYEKDNHNYMDDYKRRRDEIEKKTRSSGNSNVGLQFDLMHGASFEGGYAGKYAGLSEEKRKSKKKKAKAKFRRTGSKNRNRE